VSDWTRYLLDARIAAAPADASVPEGRSASRALAERVHFTVCCSRCGAERCETLAWFRAHAHFTCASCRAIIGLDDGHMREAKDALTVLGAACDFLDQRYRRSA
jgi:transposase-like protein